MPKTLRISSHDLREANGKRGAKHPYGWIYFNDGNRVRFAGGMVFPSYFGASTNQHLELAYAYLTEQKVKGYKNKRT